MSHANMMPYKYHRCDVTIYDLCHDPYIICDETLYTMSLCKLQWGWGISIENMIYCSKHRMLCEPQGKFDQGVMQSTT